MSVDSAIETSTNDPLRSLNDRTCDSEEKVSGDPAVSHPKIRKMMTA